MWVVLVIVILGIIGNFVESFSDFEDWDVVWDGIKKALSFILAMVFLPLVIMFGRTKESRSKKDPRH